MTTPKLDILIVIDNKMRDGVACHLVGERLKQIGLSVKYTNKFLLYQSWWFYRPKVVVLTYTRDWQFAEIFSKSSKIVILQTEGSISVDDPGFLNLYQNEKPHLAQKYLLWGNKPKQKILEHNLIPEKKLVVCSTPRIEAYSKNFIGDKLKTDRLTLNPQNENKPQSVGMPISGMEFLFPYHRNLSLFDRIANDRNLKPHQVKYYDMNKGRNTEDAIWFASWILRQYLDFSDHFTSKGFTVNLRPGPFEDFGNYQNYIKKNKNTHLDSFTYLPKWITQNSFLFLGHTTVGMEAILAGVPPIYFYDLEKERIKDHLGVAAIDQTQYAKYYWRPKDKQELLDLSEKALSGTLPASPVLEEFKIFMKEYYDIPRTELPSVSVAREIAEVL